MADAELVRRVRTGDADAFGLLLHQNRPMVIRAAARIVRDETVVEELVQEASLAAFLSLKDLRDPGRFGPWFCGIALNLCRSHVRRESSVSPLTGMPPDSLAKSGTSSGTNSGQDDNPATLLEEKELRALLLEAVGELPPTMRSATLLFYYRQMSVREIAANLGVSVGAVKVRLNRARSRLRERFAIPAPESINVVSQERKPAMQKVYVADVIESESGRKIYGDGFSGLLVILAAESGGRALPIHVGRDIGAAIAATARETEFPRPQTFAFIESILDVLGGSVEQVAVNRLDGDTFYSTVRISGSNGAKDIDARPSDAIALASRLHCPIYVSEEVMDQCGIDVPENQAPGRGLDALVTEMEEGIQRQIHHTPLSEEEQNESYRRLAEMVFGDD